MNSQATSSLHRKISIDATDSGHQPLNADGCTESRTYDELNRLTKAKDAQNNSTAFTYDFYGNRTTLTDAASHMTTFKYDDLGRMTQIIDPLVETPTDKTQLFGYDEAGNLIQATDRKGQVTQYTYDRLNRNTQTLHIFDNSTESNTFDGFGDLIQTQNSAVSYTYSYTLKHQLKSKTDSRLNKTLSWTYDPVGNIDTKTDYQGDSTDYQYNSANRLVAETNPAYVQVSYHYDGAGRLLDRILSNGAITHYGWDTAGRLTQLQNTTVTGQTVNNTRYTRDRIGNVLTQIENGQAGTTFTYDPEYRLLSADYPGTANDEAYSYDTVGNRKSATKGALLPIASSRYYNYNAGNRLIDTRTGSAIGTVFENYQYDDNGSLTNITGNRSLTLTWDLNNRVSQINTHTFNYDRSGYRIKKAGSAIKNYYLEGEHLESVYDGNGTVQAQYLRGTIIDEIVNGYQKDSNGKLINTTFHHDTLQSVLGQSGHDGSLLATQSYSAFGNSVNQTGTSNNAQKYTGREQDSETGFYYYRARYYDPITGRFISEDPKGFAAGVNFYAYAGNNPINANDPTGNCPGCLLNTLLNSPQLNSSREDLGIAIFNLNPRVNSSLETDLINHYFRGSGSDFTMTTNQWTNYNSALKTGNNSYYDQGVGSVPSTPPANGSIDSYDFDPFYASWRTPANNLMNMGANIIGPLLGGDNFNIYSPTVNSSSSLIDTISNYLGNSFANGGFLLYPNKSNTNQMQSVYSK
jgi:RHS repeat-associated protein